jgi:hypothetical protein
VVTVNGLSVIGFRYGDETDGPAWRQAILASPNKTPFSSTMQVDHWCCLHSLEPFMDMIMELRRQRRVIS